MISYQRNTTLITSVVVVSLIFVATAWAATGAASEQRQIRAGMPGAAVWVEEEMDCLQGFPQRPGVVVMRQGIGAQVMHGVAPRGLTGSLFVEILKESSGTGKQEGEIQQEIEILKESGGAEGQEGEIHQEIRILKGPGGVEGQEDEVRQEMEIHLARPFASNCPGEMASRVLANAEEIGLDENQENEIRALHRENRRAEIRRSAEIQIAEMDLDEMMGAEDLDLDAIEEKMHEIANYQVDGRMDRLRLDRSVSAVLTEAQRDELEEMSAARFILGRTGQ
jgi:Spy/CpxP family protein refolding chaperone